MKFLVSDEIFGLVDKDVEYSGSGDFLTTDLDRTESENDLFFTVPLVSETSTTKAADKTVTNAKMSDVVTDTNVTCDESGFCSDPMPTDISLEDFFGFDTMTKIQNTGMNSTFFNILSIILKLFNNSYYDINTQDALKIKIT